MPPVRVTAAVFVKVGTGPGATGGGGLALPHPQAQTTANKTASDVTATSVFMCAT